MERGGDLRGEHRDERDLLRVVPVVLAAAPEQDRGDALDVVHDGNEKIVAREPPRSRRQALDDGAELAPRAALHEPAPRDGDAERFEQIRAHHRLPGVAENVHGLARAGIALVFGEHVADDDELRLVGLEDVPQLGAHALAHDLLVDHREQLAAEGSHPRARVAPLAGHEALRPLLDAREDGLEGDDEEDDESRLEKLDPTAGEPREERGDLPDDDEVGRRDERRGGHVQDAPARDDAKPEELVPHDRVGDRAAADDERGVDEGGRCVLVPGEPSENVEQARERKRDDAEAEAADENPYLPLHPRRHIRSRRVDQDEEREAGVRDVHEGEELHVRPEQQVHENAEHPRDLLEEGARRAHRHGNPGDPAEHPRRAHAADEENEENEVKDVRQKQHPHESPHEMPRAMAAGEDEREENERREKELPHVREARREIAQEERPFPRIDLEQVSDGSEQRPEAREEEHERGEPAHGAPPRLPHDRHGEKEHDDAAHEVEGCEKGGGAHRDHSRRRCGRKEETAAAMPLRSRHRPLFREGSSRA